MEQSLHATSGVAETPSVTSGSHRIKNACTECKRRKIKCDGTAPCYYCRWYKYPERCVYTQPAPRPILTRKSLASLQSKLEDATSVLKRLFPTSSLDELTGMSREGLIERLDIPQSGSWRGSTQAEVTSMSDANSQSPASTRARRPSTSPTAFEYNETVEGLEAAEAIADDVNALSLKADRTSSYVGPSSATAGLRILLQIAPDLKDAKSKAASQLSPSGPDVPSWSPDGGVVAKGCRDPRRLVDAYFHHVHPATPILDEAQFRATFEADERKDSPWMALLHMVLALGMIAYTTSDSHEDIYYYKVAKSHLSLDSFGSGNMETLQALMLMTGWYLHYRNRPNMASAIMGAVLRMANALGLHKELPGEETSQDQPQRELRRRIWWSLVVLDAGEGITLGRVSNIGVFDSENGEVTTGPTAYSAFVANIEFSRQSAKIQERLISSPSLEFSETLALDAHLVYWFDSLPDFLKSLELYSDRLRQPKLSAKWKYQNLRIILYRPTLMEAALRGIPFQDLNSEQKVCIRKCQSLALEAIDQISAEWAKNQYSGWPAVWYLFQASIIPLLSLYGFKDDPQQTEGWDRQVQKAIRLFNEMEPWSIAARQTHELVSLLYEKYHKPHAVNDSSAEGSSAMVGPFRFSDNSQTSSLGPQSQNTVEWSLWEGLYNFPELTPPVSAFPDLNLPDLGPGINSWDLTMEITESWSGPIDPSIRQGQDNNRGQRSPGEFSRP